VVFVCAIVAAITRYSGLPREVQLGAFIINGFFLAYIVWRWTAAWHRFDRWNQIQQHRADLADWAREKKRQLKQRAASPDSVPPED